MIPVYLDMFILTAAVCFDQVSFSSMITLRKRASVTRVISVPAMHTSIFEYSIFFVAKYHVVSFLRFSDRPLPTRNDMKLGYLRDKLCFCFVKETLSFRLRIYILALLF